MNRSASGKTSIGLVVGLLLIGSGVFIAASFPFYRYSPFFDAVRVARMAYQDSRGETALDEESFEFVTFGVTAGMSEQEVDDLMSDSTFPPFRGTRESPPWDGFIRRYEFEYGRPYSRNGSDKPEHIIEESLTVLFDTDGRARRISRHVSRHDSFRYWYGGGTWGNWDVDLDAQEIER